MSFMGKKFVCLELYVDNEEKEEKSNFQTLNTWNILLHEYHFRFNGESRRETPVTFFQLFSKVSLECEKVSIIHS